MFVGEYGTSREGPGKEVLLGGGGVTKGNFWKVDLFLLLFLCSLLPDCYQVSNFALSGLRYDAYTSGPSNCALIPP